MAIVPIVNDVSIGDIRDIINIKATVIGTATWFPARIIARVHNLATISQTVTFTIAGPTSSLPQVKTISPNAYRIFSFSNLAAGPYICTISLPDGRSTSQAGESKPQSASEKHFLYINNNYTVENISIAKDNVPPPTPATTSNYLRADGINIPYPLPSTNINADLSDWRGAQVFNAVYTGKDSSLTPIYDDEAYTGKISFTLYPTGFSSGSVSIKIGNKVYTKTITGAGTSFSRSGLAAGTYSCSITDLVTNNKLSFNITLESKNYVQSRNRGTINGTDRITFSP